MGFSFGVEVLEEVGEAVGGDGLRVDRSSKVFQESAASCISNDKSEHEAAECTRCACYLSVRLRISMGSSSKLSWALTVVGLATSSLVAKTSPPSSSPSRCGSTAGERVLCGVLGLLPEWLDALARAVSTLCEGDEDASNLLKDFVEATLGRVLSADAVGAMVLRLQQSQIRLGQQAGQSGGGD